MFNICSKIIFSVPNEIKTTDFYSVHRRGTDHSMHTEVVTAQNFIDLMSNHFELYKNKTIYIATDDDGFIGVLRATYPAVLETAKSILKNQRSFEIEKKIIPIKKIISLV